MLPEAYLDTMLDLFAKTKKPTWCRLVGNSMAPLLCHGDRLLVQPGNQNIRIGDVIVFKSSKVQCAHRAVGITSDRTQKQFIVKGDNSNHFDQPVFPDQILAKVLRVKGSYGTLYLDSVSWRAFNIFIAIYSYIEARRHKGDTPFWRILGRLFTLCRQLVWCKQLHRRNLYKYLFTLIDKIATLATTKGEQSNDIGKTS
jgi:signal peptidase I